MRILSIIVISAVSLSDIILSCMIDHKLIFFYSGTVVIIDKLILEKKQINAVFYNFSRHFLFNKLYNFAYNKVLATN